MFQSLVKLFTAASFVAHALLGCCWHHSHTHALSAEPAATARSGCHGHGHCHHKSHSGRNLVSEAGKQGNDSHSPHDSGCHEERCVFIRTLDTSNSATDVAASLMPFAVLALSLDSQFLSLTDARALLERECGGPPIFSAPFCALNQVWLI